MMEHATLIAAGDHSHQHRKQEKQSSNQYKGQPIADMARVHAMYLGWLRWSRLWFHKRGFRPNRHQLMIDPTYAKLWMTYSDPAASLAQHWIFALAFDLSDYARSHAA